MQKHNFSKWLLFILVALIGTIGLGMSAETSTAQAASWHRGMPKALNGHWKPKKVVIMGDPGVFIRANYFDADGGIDPVINVNLSYHHAKGSHYYYVRGHEKVYSHQKLARVYNLSATHN